MRGCSLGFGVGGLLVFQVVLQPHHILDSPAGLRLVVKYLYMYKCGYVSAISYVCIHG